MQYFKYPEIDFAVPVDSDDYECNNFIQIAKAGKKRLSEIVSKILDDQGFTILHVKKLQHFHNYLTS